MREKLLNKLGNAAAHHPWRLLSLIVIITIIMAALAGQLKLNMNMTEMFPEDHPIVEEFDLLMREFNGASSVVIGVQGEPDAMIAFAENVAPDITLLSQWIEKNGSEKVRHQHQTVTEKQASGEIPDKNGYFTRVDFKIPTEFIRNHGLMLVKEKDLVNTSEMYNNPNLLPFLRNLNSSLEKEYIQSDEKTSTIQKEQSAVSFLDGLETWVAEISTAIQNPSYQNESATIAADAITVGIPYMISPDRKMLLMMAMPTFSMMEINPLMPAINGLEELLKSRATEFGVDVGLAGGIVIQRDEMNATTEDSMTLTLLALAAVFLLFVFTFRMISAPILAILNLIIGIIWAMGLSALFVDSLNLLTAMMSVVLVGLGIDFAIHIISLYSELTNRGLNITEAITQTLVKAGTGILTGGFTTAAAFLTLIISRSKAMTEFGLVCGIGLLTIMMCTLVTLPTFLIIKDRLRLRKTGREVKHKDVSFTRLGTIGQKSYSSWKITLAIMALLTVAALFFGRKVEFDYNFLNLEPKGLESVKMNDQIVESFNMSTEASMLSARSLKENYELTERAREMSTIRVVESISDYLPDSFTQAKRRPGITAIHQQMAQAKIQKSFSQGQWLAFIDELFRLESNVIEMQDLAFTGGQDMVDAKATRLVGNPDHPEIAGILTQFLSDLQKMTFAKARWQQLNQDFGEAFQENVLAMSNTEPISIDMLPQMVRDKYVSRNGDIFLVTTYPGHDVWNLEFLLAHTQELQTISPRVTGTVPLFYFAIDVIGKDGKRASILAIIIIFLFLLIDFRSFRSALLALMPLVIGVIWTLGLMRLLGIKFTMVNVIALPVIIGIGIDDGVHLLHRYRIEGKGEIYPVFASTGKAIIITSLTTMLSFGSLVFATYRGFGTLGSLLFVGVGCCLLTSIFVLPMMLGATKS
ncbi:MMPL family transporter [bacterium]|nr:MMPL family transporter [bacterium]